MELIKKYKIIIALVILAIIYSYFNYLKPIEGNKYVDKSSDFYINDLYQSKALNYYLLSEKNQKLYDEILKSYKNFDETPELDLIKYGCEAFQNCDISITSAWNALMLDHPELIQLSGYSYRYYNDSPIVNLRLQSALTLDFQYYLGTRKIAIMIDDIKNKTTNMSEKEKVRYVYEWIGKQSSYDRTFTYSSKNQSIYSVFIQNSGVCAAYAKAAQIIFQNIDIESYLLLGQSTGPHMWNIVEVEGSYYYFDATVASAVKEGDARYYDGLKQSYMSSFTYDNRDLYPTTSSNEYLIN